MSQPQNLSLSEKVVELISCTAPAMEKAAAAEDAAEAQRVKIAKLIPGVVDALVTHERITPDQRERATAVLQDPVQALELLGKVAAHRNANEQSLGQSTKQASHVKQAAQTKHSSLTTPFVGRPTTAVKESDKAIFGGLGLAIPQNS